MLMIDADKVDTDLLRNAKAIASLALDLTTDNQVDVFPHHLGGGWPAVRPGNDDMVTYGRIQAGQYKGVPATAYGANKQVRHRGLAIALFLSVVRLHPRVFPDRAASQNTALLSLVALAKSEHQEVCSARPCGHICQPRAAASHVFGDFRREGCQDCPSPLRLAIFSDCILAISGAKACCGSDCLIKIVISPVLSMFMHAQSI